MRRVWRHGVQCIFPPAYHAMRSCADCLQNCRFHVVYPESNLFGGIRVTEHRWDVYEFDICDEIDEGMINSHSIELVKAQDILSGNSWQSFCGDCEPICLSVDDSCKFCRCELYSYFVERWRCIPCVLAEQTRSVSEKQHYKIRYRPEYADRPDVRNLLYFGVSIRPRDKLVPLPLLLTGSIGRWL